MSELLLGIDIGTASTKAVVARPDGELIASAQRPHRLSLPRPGWAEHDVESVWWEGLLDVCARLRPHTRDGLAGVCVSGVGPCVVLCDDHLRPLHRAILYGIDTRAGAEVDELTERYGQDAILRRGGSTLSSQALGPKLLWLRRHEPDLWRRARGWYMASSYLLARLTGEYVLDHHSASQCDPLYELGSEDWAHDWAEEIAPGVPLPRLVWPHDQVGIVGTEAAALTGLPAGTPVMAGTIDAWAEAFSVGVRRPGDLMLMYGSTLFMVQVADVLGRDPSVWGTVGVERGSRTVAAGMATAGALTDWMRGLTGSLPWPRFAAEAEAVAPGADGLLLLPYFAGERTPILDPDARGVIVGLTLAHGRGHLARAAYEGTALALRHNLEVLEGAAGAPRRVVAVGGGTHSRVWLQIASDVTGVEQDLPAQRVGAAYGDALLAAIGTGLIPPETDWTAIEERVTPALDTAETYAGLYELFRELYPATRATSHGLAAMQAITKEERVHV